MFGNCCVLFSSDVFPGAFSNNPWSFPASSTRFSRYQRVWYCRQHHQLQYLCYRNHRRFSTSFSIPSSPRRSSHYPNLRAFHSLSCAEHFYYRPTSICYSQPREGSSFSRAEHFYHHFPPIRRSCECLSSPPLALSSPQIGTSLSCAEHLYCRCPATCDAPWAHDLRCAPAIRTESRSS